MEENQIDPISTVKVLDTHTTEFMANGRTYFVNYDIERLSIGRLQKYEQFQIELGFALSFDSLFNSLTTACNLLFDKKDMQSAYMELKNLQRGIAKVNEDRNSMAIWLCTLFINRAGEDISIWDIDTAQAKIDDWEKENIGAGFFLGFALSLVENYRNRFNSILEEYQQLSELSKQLNDSSLLT